MSGKNQQFLDSLIVMSPLNANASLSNRNNRFCHLQKIFGLSSVVLKNKQLFVCCSYIQTCRSLNGMRLRSV